MKKITFTCLVVILFSGAFAPAEQFGGLIETAQAIAIEANATADYIWQQNYQYQPVQTEQPMSPVTGGLEPLYFNGKGDDLLLVDILPKQYPYVYIVNNGRNFFTVKGFDRDGKYILMANNVGRYSGFAYLADSYVEKIETIEIDGGKDWEMLFLPAGDKSIETYKAPIIISGNEPSIFFLENAGPLVEADFSDDKNITVYQFDSSGRQNLMFNEIGPYSGKARFSKGQSLIVVNSVGSWTMKFYGPNNEAPEDSVSIEYRISDDLKSVTSTTPTPEPEAEVIPAKLGQKINCGDSFQFMFYYQPIMTKSQSYQTAVGKFLMFRVHITNMTTSAIDGLSDSSFKLHGNFNGVEQTFKLDTGSSFSTSYRWDIGQISDTYQPGIPVDTYLVFDVTGKADSWYLEFAPKSGNKTYCNVNISVPKINYTD